jgi:hypothetical protein
MTRIGRLDLSPALDPKDEPPPPPPPPPPKPEDFVSRSLATPFVDVWRESSPRRSLRAGFDFSKLSDNLAPSIERADRDLGTFAIDWLATGPAYDVLGYLIEAAKIEITGEDATWKGSHRLIRDLKERGLGAFRVEGMEWKDGNFASIVNLVHGVPFTLSSGLLRARGYDPGVAMIGGIVSNLVHEFVFEAWEQPKSLHDLVMMNMLGAIAGAFPELGMQIGFDADRGRPFTTFYGESDNGDRYSVTFEQKRDFFAEGVPVEDRPVLPYDLIFGADLKVESGLNVALDLRLVTDPDEKTDPLHAIKDLEITASVRWLLP